MPVLEVFPFAAEHVGEAADLLARRQASLRLVEPLLPEQFERRDETEPMLAALLVGGASGAVACRGGQLVAYVLGAAREESWGPNIWVPLEGAAASEGDLLRDAYATAAQRWFDEGRLAHYALIPTQDPAVVRAWSHLCFGIQHVHAACELPVEDSWADYANPRHLHDLAIRRATADDAECVGPFDIQMAELLRRAPVFSPVGVPLFADALAEATESLGDHELATFVAERAGRVIAAAVGCDITQSSANSGLARPNDAGMFAWVVVDEQQRGAGVGRALAVTVMQWAHQSGFRTIVTDWRAANLGSSRAWPPLGFRETFYRMHRLIGY